MRLSDFAPGGAVAKGGQTPRSHSDSGFVDLSPGPVRLSEGLSSGYSAPGGRSALGYADEELGELENDLQKQSQQSSEMMAAIMARLNALES